MTTIITPSGNCVVCGAPMTWQGLAETGAWVHAMGAVMDHDARFGSAVEGGDSAISMTTGPFAVGYIAQTDEVQVWAGMILAARLPYELVMRLVDAREALPDSRSEWVEDVVRQLGDEAVAHIDVDASFDKMMAAIEDDRNRLVGDAYRAGLDACAAGSHFGHPSGVAPTDEVTQRLAALLPPPPAPPVERRTGRSVPDLARAAYEARREHGNMSAWDDLSANTRNAWIKATLAAFDAAGVIL